jgi:hypothetical protein
MTLKHAVPVRLPGARIALTTKTLACTHTGLENNGANSTIRGNNSAGRVSIGKPPGREDVFLSVRCLLLLFQRAKMAKVELRKAITGWNGCSHCGIPVASEGVRHFHCWSKRCHAYAKARGLI